METENTSTPTPHTFSDASSYLQIEQKVRETEPFVLPTWSLMSLMVALFIILKTFIYWKDNKRKEL